MAKAFLSHSSVDKDVVRKIKQTLQRFWTIFDEDCFEPGMDFRASIVDHLKDTNLFVLFASKNSLASSWVHFELDEVYWLTAQQKNITTLVLALEDISPSDLPPWMRRAKYEPVRTVNLAAQVIKRTLFRSMSVGSGVYMGRETDTTAFIDEIAQHEDRIPNIFVINGLSGIGRRTFIKDILDRRFSLGHFPLFEISESEGLIELYRKLLDDNLDGLAGSQADVYYRDFQSYSLEDQAGEIARLLADYTTKARTCPSLVDNGEILDDNGRYQEKFLIMLRIFGEKYPDSYLTLIHTRMPKLYPCDQPFFQIYRLRALKPNSCYSLFDALLRRHNVPITNSAQVKEIAEYLEGYPPAIINAVQECRLEGVDLVFNDKRGLMDFQERVFKSYLEKLQLNEEELDILAVLYNMGGLCVRPLAVILGKPVEAVAKTLMHVHDCNIVEMRTDGTYGIAPPMRAAMERKLHRFGKKEFSSISNKLIEAFWKPEESISFDLIDNMIYAVLRSGQEERLKQFKDLLLPSHLLKVAEKANQDRDWATMENYARIALKLDKNLLRAKAILFRALVRQESSQNRAKSEKEENELLDDLQAAHDKGVYYLEGFRLVKRGKHQEAIKKFQLAIQSGDTSIPVYRDLAESYYRIDQVGKAQEVIKVLMDGRKIDNSFILDLAAKIAISGGDFDEANEILGRQELRDRPENVAHRWATYYMKKGDYPKALECAKDACNGERPLPEMHLVLMNIALHLPDYSLVQEQYDFISGHYNQYNHDVLEVLYVTMLLQRDGWESAEAGYQRIRGEKNPYVRNLRYKIVCAKLEKGNIALQQRKTLERERDELKKTKRFDPLHQFQCFDAPQDA